MMLLLLGLGCLAFALALHLLARNMRLKRTNDHGILVYKGTWDSIAAPAVMSVFRYVSYLLTLGGVLLVFLGAQQAGL